MATTDWHDALGALMQNFGSDTEPDPVQPEAEESQTQNARLDIVFEKKGRGGKMATIVTGFTISDDDVDTLASEMKKRLGAGGSARGGEILIQGDRRNDVLKFLVSKGFKARII